MGRPPLLLCLLALGAAAALAAAQAPAAECAEPCWVVQDYHPFPSCKATCDKETCGRGVQRALEGRAAGRR
jgi:hypothetical protein